MKEIRKIVIYTCKEYNQMVAKSCIFYNDGSIKNGTKDDAIEAIKEVSKSKNITSKEELRDIMNKDIIYTMTEEEFKKNYISFLFDINKEEKIEKEERIPGFIEVQAPRERTNEEVEEVIYSENYSVEDEEYDPYTGVYNSEEENTEETVLTEKEKYYLKVAAGVLALAIGAAGVVYACSRCTRKSKVGTMAPVVISTESQKDNKVTPVTTNETTTNETTETIKETKYIKPAVYNNDLYNDYDYSQLLYVTKSDFQKAAMINLGASLTGFNSSFANNYIESGHDIKAALSFEEMVALQQAYNSYSVAEVRSYFNGYEVDAVKMSNDYKSASLQLMGAYIIESKEHPVDMSILIDSQEGRDFYNKYHKMFLAAKEATGNEKLRLVNELYKTVREDFPVTTKVRTEGISHSEKHNSIKDYQLAVAPMIAASEMLFQNLKTNYTLNNMEVNFINDIGLCNHADDKFERIETIMLCAYEDKENPLYIQYRNAIVNELTAKNNYVIDDEHRELSNLRRFQEIVNNDALYKYRTAAEKAKSNGSTTNNNNKTTKRTYTKTTTTKKTVTETKNGGPIPSDKKAEIDKKTDEDNKKAKEEVEKKAKEEAARQQAEENAKKKAIEESIAKANEEKKKKAEEEAKKDNSVKNVSPSSGPKQTLPDPNEYGKNFDERVKVKTK